MKYQISWRCQTEWCLRCTGKEYIFLQHVWHFSQHCLTLHIRICGCFQYQVHAAKLTLFVHVLLVHSREYIGANERGVTPCLGLNLDSW